MYVGSAALYADVVERRAAGKGLETMGFEAARPSVSAVETHEGGQSSRECGPRRRGARVLVRQCWKSGSRLRRRTRRADLGDGESAGILGGGIAGARDNAGTEDDPMLDPQTSAAVISHYKVSEHMNNPRNLKSDTASSTSPS